MQEAPVEHRFHGDDMSLCYFQWGPGNGPTVLLVHATGFHARCWDRTVAALPEGYRVIAPDMRGHGRSQRRGPYLWHAFGADLAAFTEHLGLEDAIGVGHSMGGHCVTQVAGQRPGTFSRLLLLDPVILDPAVYGDRHGAFASAEDHPVARRRNRWASWQEMYQRFADRYPFSAWRPEVLEDYCRYGVLPAADGDGFELACPPAVEASIYMGNAKTDVHDLVPAVDIPVTVVRARERSAGDGQEMDFSKSPTWPRLAGAFPRGHDVYLPELTHFIPMQDPELVARFIVDPEAGPHASA